MSKGRGDESYGAILLYMKNQNRPYSINDLVSSSLKDHGKAQIQKSVDQLVADNTIVEKSYGKQKVYWINQNEFGSFDASALSTMDREIAELTREVQANEEAIKKGENELKILTSSLTVEEAKTQLAQLMEENKKMEEKLSNITKNREKVSAADLKKAQQMKTKTVTEWRKRKRLCTDMLDAILESYPKPKKALIEEVGIEADEDVGVKIPS